MKIILSKAQWELIGKRAGWGKTLTKVAAPIHTQTPYEHWKIKNQSLIFDKMKELGITEDFASFAFRLYHGKLTKEEKMRRARLVSRIKEWEKILGQATDQESIFIAKGALKSLNEMLQKGDKI